MKRIPSEVYQEIDSIVVVEDVGKGNRLSSSDELKSKFSKLTVLYHDERKGYGGAQKTGLQYAVDNNADVAVILHADGQYAPEVLKELYLSLISKQADIVLGSRMKNPKDALAGGMPYYKWVANIVLTKIENYIYKMKLSEYHSGYMLCSGLALRSIPFKKLTNDFHFDGEMLMMGHRKKLRISEVPIPTSYGDEISYLNPIKYGIDVLRTVVKYLLGKYDF